MKKAIVILFVSVTTIVAAREFNIDTKLGWFSQRRTFEVIEVDGCEYLMLFDGGHGVGLTHKGNCKFCK